MRVITMILLSFFVIVGCNTDEIKKENTSIKKLPKEQRIGLLAKMEAKMTQNPATGEIPRNKLYEVRQNLLSKNASTYQRMEADWNVVGPTNVGGRSRAMLVDSRDASGSTIYTGGVSGGMWKCTDTKTDPKWELIAGYTGSPSISCIVQDPNNPEIMYVGTGEGWFTANPYRGDGIYKSIDGGENWDRLPQTASDDFVFVQSLLINQNGDILASTKDNGVMMSTDEGMTWVAVLNNTNQGFSNRAADLEMGSNGVIFASMGISTEDGIYRSKDDGITWEYMNIGVNDIERIEMAISDSNPDFIIALMEGSATGICKYIMRSKDGGDTWESINVPAAVGMDEFTRRQAYYDLTVEIDPNNENIVYIGGIDLHQSRDGGDTWRQVSLWYDSGGGVPYVHADQHSITYASGNSDEVYFTNDGGIWLSVNASSSNPVIRDISRGYITTQFYGIDLHPEAGRKLYVGGAQDNGTSLVYGDQDGLASSLRGGDGAIPHIDQLDPNYQVVASQRGFYQYTTNGWATTSVADNEEGFPYFINPSDYDDVNKIMYATHSFDQVYALNLDTGSEDIYTYSELDFEVPSGIKVDPTDSEVLYVGSEEGTLIRVTNPRSDNPTGELLFRQAGYIRNIEVDDNKPDRLLVTYSNYGVESVFYSDDRGGSWTSIEGDLPDIPVRWGIFNPTERNKVLLATELGVWEADVTVSPVVWTYVSTSMGTSRVDMLKYRDSDYEMLAGTYGRGMFTTKAYRKSGVSFFMESIIATESGDYNEELCTSVSTYDIDIQLDKVYENDVEVEVVVEESSTLKEFIDFQIPNKTVIIPAGELRVSTPIEIYDNTSVGDDQSIILSLSSDANVIGGKMNINVQDNDKNIEAGTVIESEVTIGTGNESDMLLFNGEWEDAHTKILYTDAYLGLYGVGAGGIGALSFNVEQINSDGIYENAVISMGLVDVDGFDGNTIYDDNLEVVYSGDIVMAEGELTIELDKDFYYDGNSNLMVSLCFDNDNYLFADIITASGVTYQGLMTTYTDNVSGCISERNNNTKLSNILPDIKFAKLKPAEIFNRIDTSLSSRLTEGRTSYFSHNDSLLIKTKRAEDSGIDCFSASLYENSDEIVTSGTFRWYVRVYNLTNENTADDNNVVTLFFPKSAKLEDMSINEIYYSEDIIDENNSSFTTIEIIEKIDNESYTAITFLYQDDGYYVAGNIMTGLNDLENDGDYDTVLIFDVLGREVTEIVGNVPTGIYIQTYVKNNRVLKSEKIFITRN